ncbi:glycine/betaine ABC transporter [Bacillus coahuilensis m2-6]|uniref:glycine betaine ABC transporter substrate-binding protein n=1 Tax=Bacillus coahuilensis TaxID=408580 RepID=UPI0001850CF4|nr:glycine betaine ABC transporter substrate-binding protein [Bacillus coahuilensis]KUP08300.1 glycine/betaine ABC transporter [Bacillus coahuilensis m2-6]
MKKKTMTLASMTIAAGMLLGACSEETSSSKGELEFAINNWAENVAVSNMWKVVLEEKGYEVKLTELEKAGVWTSVAEGDVDIAPEAWLPFTDEPFYKEYKDSIITGDSWYEGTGLGIAVPTYMSEVTTLEDLSNVSSELDGKIFGIEAGTSLMDISGTMLEEYNLDYELVQSSEPAMLTELKKAMDDESPVAVTLWNPHWAFAEYDIKYLEDPRGVYGEPDNIHYLAREGFDKDYPEVFDAFEAWELNDDQLGTLMKYIEDSSPEEGAKKWVEENQDLITSWME